MMRPTPYSFVLLAGCTGLLGGLPQDDAGVGSTPGVDSGSADAGSADAGAPDSGSGDAGVPDAGSADAATSTWDGGFSRWDAGDDGLADAAVVDPPGFGAGAIDALLAGLDAGSWVVVPGSTMQSVCPGYLDGGTGDHYLCGAMMTAWSGAVFDDARDRLVVFGGGHADSYYNQVSAFDLTTLRWLALSGVVADQPWNREPFYERCGYYPTGAYPIDDAWRDPSYSIFARTELCGSDLIAPHLDLQQPRSTHTYGNLAYVPAADALCLTGSIALYQSGQTGSRVMPCFDFKRRRWTRLADVPTPGYGMTAVDASGHVWLLHVGSFAEYLPAQNAWEVRGAGLGTLYASVAIEPASRRLFVLTPGTASLQAISLDGGMTVVDRAPPPPDLSKQDPGFAWVSHLGRFYAWSGGRALYVYDPVSDSWTTETGTGDDPGQPATNGTYGRFRYSPNRHVLVLVNDTQQNVAIYKLR